MENTTKLTESQKEEQKLFHQILEDERQTENTVDLFDGSHDASHVKLMKKSLKNKN